MLSVFDYDYTYLPEGGGGVISGNFWWGCAARLPESRLCSLHTRFQTRSLKSIPVFRPDISRN